MKKIYSLILGLLTLTSVPAMAGNGTEASPYAASEALNAITSGNFNPDQEVYIAGKVSSVVEINTQYGNGTYYLSDDGTDANALQVYRGYGLGGAKFTSEDALKVGDDLVIKGKLILFKDTTPEVGTGSSIISINGSSTPSTPDTPDTPTSSYTKENPMDCATLIAMNPSSTSEAVESGAWLKGYIVGCMPTAKYAEAVFEAADINTNILVGPTADCKDYTLCVGIQLPTGSVRAALNLVDNPGNIGKEVLLCGDVMKYCGGPGLKNVSAYEFVGGGSSTPDTPADGSIYTGLVSGMEDWVIENVTVPSYLTEAEKEIFFWNESYKCLYATAYNAEGSADSEAYCYTTVDLSKAVSATLSFDQAAKFQTTLRELCGPVVREAGATAWTRLTVPTWCEAGSWAFVNSGDIDLAAYCGKKVEIGFVYGSTPNGADSWEIKNFVIKGESGIEAVAADNNAPVVYYNLQGVRVNNPQNGVYVRVQGNKASKVLVK